MDIDEEKINPENINLDDLDLYLSLFLWPKVPNCEKIRDLKDPANFNDDNYDTGVASYIKWLSDSFPQINDKAAAQEQHNCLRLQVFALLKRYDPTHPIFDMLN